MARAEVNTYAPNPIQLNSPNPKRSRLSLRHKQFPTPTCYREDEAKCNGKSEDMPKVEDITLKPDENTSPNVSSQDLKTEAPTEDLKKEEDVKVWTLGLPNCGNTCFVNSILQVLRYTPDFLKTLHALLFVHHHLTKASNEEDTKEANKEAEYFKYMHALYSAMRKKENLMRSNVEKDYSGFLLKPVKNVINSLREISLLFEEGEQHDAHEFFITTMSAYSSLFQKLKKVSANMSDETEESERPQKRRRSTKSPLDLSILDTLDPGFEGKIRHIVQCLECEKRLEREESFANLEVNIPEGVSSEDSVDLHQCLSQTTMLSGDNKYFCEECLRYNEARMSSEVVTLPPNLLLHFSWLRRSSEANAEKTSLKMVIPFLLETSNQHEIFHRSPSQSYTLYAMILHIGKSTEDGHYVAFIRDTSPTDFPNKAPGGQHPWYNSSTPEHCCSGEGTANLRDISTPSSRWLLFDDSTVSQVIIDEGAETFPYFDYLSTTASPCLIFYHTIIS